jgi:hypothetical protein
MPLITARRRSSADDVGWLTWVNHIERRSQYTPRDKEEELPMSEDALLRWYYTGVVVLALALWIVWYRIA